MRWAAVLLMPLLAGCARDSFNLATQREEYSFTSTEKEVAMGRQIARQVEEELAVVADEPLQDRVRALGARIVGVCDRKELIYHFAVVKDDEVNAFSLPGGYVYLNAGLVKAAANDDELASVIAHEVGHVCARHAVKRYESSLGSQLVQLAAIASRQGAAARGVSIAMQAAQLAYARDNELAADRLAVKYLKAAGFDPRGMLGFLEKLREVDRNNTQYLPRGVVRPRYAMTHPYVPERLRAAKEALFGVADYVDYLNTSE